MTKKFMFFQIIVVKINDFDRKAYVFSNHF